MICKVCNNIKDNKTYQIREMMFGFRDEFTYFECSHCGCLQIEEIPSTIGKYYPSFYYSLRPCTSDNIFGRLVRSNRNRYVLLRSGYIGRLLYSIPGLAYLILRASRNDINANEFDDLLQTMAKAGISLRSRILDVGSGSGRFLHMLKNMGARNLVGVDPYISEELMRQDITLYKKTIRELPKNHEYDCIIFNHSFEHMPDQLESLQKVSHVLVSNGICIIRMPLKTEYIWNLYGTNWVQIDAPRHFLIHTIESFKHLVAQAGLAIKGLVFDSGSFQFWGSEQYKQDIPLEANNSYRVSPDNSIFTPVQIREFSEMARQLNATGQGDQAAFYLMKTVK